MTDNRLFKFEEMVLQQRLDEMIKANLKEQDAINRSIDGFLPSDDSPATSADYQGSQVLNNRENAAGDLAKQIKDSKLDGTLDAGIDTSAPLEYPLVGTYVVLRIDDGEGETIDKFLLSHITDLDQKITNMEAGIGSLFSKKKVYVGENFTLEGVGKVSYELLELGWGFPVKKVEVELKGQYKDLASRFSIAKSNNNEAELEEVVDEICADILGAEEKIKYANLAYSADAKGNKDTKEKLPEVQFIPLDYISADRNDRIEIRRVTPNNLIHWHRIADQYQRHIERLKDLYNDCKC